MSMMDVMNQAGQETAPPAQGQPPAAPGGQPPPQEMMRMGEGDPKELEALFSRVMALISSEIWEKNGADQVAEQLTQEESQPAEVVGKFTGFYLMLATGAAKAKGGMLPPIVVAEAAGQVAAQLTDIALALKLVSPENADDTADAGALIGLEVLMQNTGAQMAGDERQEYQDVLQAIIKASPTAQQMADEGTEDAVEDAADMLGMGEEQPPQGMGEEQPPQGAGGGMAAAMGGV